MPQSSLFTSNFKKTRYERENVRSRFRKNLIVTLLWTIGGLGLIDVVVGLIFRFPIDNQRAPTSLQRYFNYGLSAEGKLRQYIGATPEKDAAILKAGWLDACDSSELPTANKLNFDIYGMSFTNHIADHMERLDSSISGHRFAAPSAPPNHSYACFLRHYETTRTNSPIQIFGILASNVKRMRTIGALTTSFEVPQPFTYPRYSLSKEGQLVGYFPSIKSQHDMRIALASAEKWNYFIKELDRNDSFYDKHVVQADIFDHTVIGRLIRRAWGQHILRQRTSSLQANEGFNGAPEIGAILEVMLLDFVTKVSEKGQRPIIILIEDQGYSGSLTSVIAPFLKKNKIEYLSTADIASPEDPSNFISDGHFTPATDEKIARTLLTLIHGAQTRK